MSLMSLRQSVVGDLMVEEVLTCDESKTIAEVVNIMAQHNIGAVVIINAIKDPVGIFTERDLLKRVVAPGLDTKSTAVSKAMTPKFVCVQVNDDLDELADIMIQGNFRHLPVVNGSKLVGIVSLRDVVKYLSNK